MKNLILGSMFVVLAPIFAAACSAGDFAVGTDQSASKGSPGIDGGACVTDSDCPAESACGYAAADKCTATGACYQFSGAQCAAYSPGCACDGTEINIACTPYPVGYFSKPLLHDGACSTGGAQDASTGAPCSVDADCGSPDLVCGYLISEACAAHGTCVAKNTGATCALFEPACTCDGQLTGIACTEYPNGYANAPIAHTGECADGGSFAVDGGSFAADGGSFAADAGK